jgi:glycosyltransferase involved in cell wall biosynthesis
MPVNSQAGALQTAVQYAPAPQPGLVPGAVSTPARTAVTLVVPLFNEEPVIPMLRDRLASFEQVNGGAYTISIVFVDDGSTDGTWPLLRQYFGDHSHCLLVQHGSNRGIAAAILTGIQTARTEVVCSIDSDCTYDVQDLVYMIPLLQPDVALVTASPYHPSGMVENVAWWRLFLSRSASRVYRLVLRQKLSTYTSCFRVYRRSAVLGITTRNTGFAGIAELLGRIDLCGMRIVEYPATLRIRTLGTSKIRIVRAAACHVMLLSRFALARLLKASASRPAA